MKVDIDKGVEKVEIFGTKRKFFKKETVVTGHREEYFCNIKVTLKDSEWESLAYLSNEMGQGWWIDWGHIYNAKDYEMIWSKKWDYIYDQNPDSVDTRKADAGAPERVYLEDILTCHNQGLLEGDNNAVVFRWIESRHGEKASIDGFENLIMGSLKELSEDLKKVQALLDQRADLEAHGESKSIEL